MGKDYPARIVDVTNSRIKVYYIGYDKVKDVWVNFNQVKTVRFPNEDLANPSYKTGQTINVRWKGNWYKATIKDISSSKYLIHYLNYGGQLPASKEAGLM